MIYTLDLSLDQLDRVQDRIGAQTPLRIIHCLWEEQGLWRDHYITVVDCEPEQALWLYLL